MDEPSAVVFRNVGQLYFPQTRVECHYSLTSDHRWSSSDWIGIFQVGWTSVGEYHTYTWALVPEGYTEGTAVNCCALFQAVYLPRPGAVEYQFVYVDKMGEVRARSRPFVFCAPKPLDELETLKEEEDEEDGEEELLLVIPRAQLLQSRLEECLRKQVDLQKDLDAAADKMEMGREKSRAAEMEWEHQREAMRKEASQLRESLRLKSEMLKDIEGRHKDVKYSQENLNSELSKLLAEKAESQQRIKDLEDDIKVLANREKEENLELERLKERQKKMSSQMKHDEEKRKLLQAESEAALAEVRGLQERLEASEHAAESLRRELRELGTRQGITHTELHQARLQVAQLTLQLSEENLVLREERANWALEREAHKHAADADKNKLQDLSLEVQRMEEWLQEERMEKEKLEAEFGRERDFSRVLLSEAKRELQELRASLRNVQREKEEQQLEKQGMMRHIHQLEQRPGVESHPKTSGEALTSARPAEDAEDEDAVSDCSSSHLDAPSGDEDASSSDTQEQTPERRAGEEKRPILPPPVHPILSELADAPLW